jgi:hypothetical protein
VIFVAYPLTLSCRSVVLPSGARVFSARVQMPDVLDITAHAMQREYAKTMAAGLVAGYAMAAARRGDPS